jgi:hypothetical protein
MPVTSRTSSESAWLAEEAMSERQYETKNIIRVTRETTRMIAAIIAAPPQVARGRAAILPNSA